MSHQRVRVLYVENANGVGGSVISLHRLLSAINRDQYEAMVVFHRHNDYRARFQEIGVDTILLASSKPGTDSTGSVNTPTRDIAAALGHYSTRLKRWYWEARAVWHFLRTELPEAVRLSRIIRERQIDLVHLNNQPNSNASGIVAAWLSRVPCVCHVRDYDPPTAIGRWLTRRITFLVYISREIENRLTQAITGVAGDIVYDGLDLVHYSPKTESDSVRQRFGLNGADFVLGNVGRLTPWKGQEVFLHALAEARPQVPNLKALIVGEPDPPSDLTYQQQLHTLAQQLGLDDVVQFTGFQADIPALIPALDVLVHSASRAEPFGLVIIEGLACGKPVIATAAGGVVEVVEDGHNGLLVPMNDGPAMARAIVKLATDPALRARLGIHARQQVEMRFTSYHFARAVEAVYRRVLPPMPFEVQQRAATLSS
jgi:glycosyltransferase involved in cell wall biosynthesis